MARVRSIQAAIYEQFANSYGPFRNQVAVFARVSATLPQRYEGIAIIVVSELNECHYCVAHHKRFLAVEKISAEGIDRLLADDHPELEAVDRLVVECARVA